MELEQRLFEVENLENLSASVLYTDHLPPMGPIFFTDLSKSSLDLSPQFDYLDSLLEREKKKKEEKIKPFKYDSYVYKPIEIAKIEIKPIKLNKYTEYFNLLDDNSQTIGLSHHPTGLGKLKIFDKEEKKEYGIPIYDILFKSLKDWSIDKE